MTGPGNKVSAFAGFSGTLVGTIDVAANPGGVLVETVGPDGKNHVIVSNSANFYRHDAGFSSTIIDTFNHFGIFYRDLGRDASGNLQAATGLFNSYVKYAGISGTVLASFSGNSGNFIDPDTSGDNYTGQVIAGVPSFAKVAGFSSTILSSFSLIFDIFITGGKALSNNDMVAVRYSALFGGIQVVSWFLGFSSTLVAQIPTPVAGPLGVEYFEGTYDFGVRVNVSATMPVVVNTVKPLNLRLVKLLFPAAAPIVLGAQAALIRLPPVVVGLAEAGARLLPLVGAVADFGPVVSANPAARARVDAGARVAPRGDAGVRLAPKVEASADFGPKR
jgi:hypothetical protein